MKTVVKVVEKEGMQELNIHIIDNNPTGVLEYGAAIEIDPLDTVGTIVNKLRTLAEAFEYANSQRKSIIKKKL